MTYAEAGQILGISPEAVRALARRQRWSRRSPNAIGGQAWVLIPADRLPANGQSVPPDGRSESDRQPESDDDRPRPAVANGQLSEAGDRPEDDRADDDRRDDRRDARWANALTAVRELADRQIAMLTANLAAERERADRAEAQIRELQEALGEQTVEHRRVVEALVARIPVRRSWWPWRR